MAFLDPDPEMQLLREDLAWPLDLATDGDLATVAGLDCLEADMVGRAATRRGEILHRPDCGLESDEDQGGPVFEEVLALTESRLLEQYTRDPRIDSMTVTVAEDSDGSGVVNARIRAIAKTGQPVGVVVPMGSA